MGIYRGVSRLFGAMRGLYLPVGVAALVALGVHLGAEAAVEGAYRVLSLGYDALQTMIGWTGALLPPEWVASASFWLARAFDVEEREAWSRVVGVLVEIGVDLKLVTVALLLVERQAPKLSHADDTSQVSRWVATHRVRWRLEAQHFAKYFGEPTIEKLYLPVACSVAAFSGVYAIFIAAEAALYEAFSRGNDAAAIGIGTTGVAMVVSTLVAWRLAVPIVDHAFLHAQDNHEQRFAMNVWRRRTKGWLVGTVVTLVTVAGFVTGTPVVRWLGMGT